MQGKNKKAFRGTFFPSTTQLSTIRLSFLEELVLRSSLENASNQGKRVKSLYFDSSDNSSRTLLTRNLTGS